MPVLDFEQQPVADSVIVTNDPLPLGLTCVAIRRPVHFDELGAGHALRLAGVGALAGGVRGPRGLAGRLRGHVEGHPGPGLHVDAELQPRVRPLNRIDVDKVAGLVGEHAVDHDGADGGVLAAQLLGHAWAPQLFKTKYLISDAVPSMVTKHRPLRPPPRPRWPPPGTAPPRSGCGACRGRGAPEPGFARRRGRFTPGRNWAT